MRLFKEIIFALLASDFAHCQAPEQNCIALDTSRQIRLYWTFNPATMMAEIRLRAEGPSTDWLAIGLGGQSQMSGMEVMMGYLYGADPPPCLRLLRAEGVGMPNQPSTLVGNSRGGYAWNAGVMELVGTVSVESLQSSVAWATGPTGGASCSAPVMKHDTRGRRTVQWDGQFWDSVTCGVPPGACTNTPPVPFSDTPAMFPCQGQPSGSHCTVMCLAGYMPSVPDVFCNNGMWEPAGTVCLPSGCPAPAMANAADLSPCAGMQSGMSCPFACLPGFVPSTSEVICYAGVWSTGVCNPMSCKTAPVVPGAVDTVACAGTASGAPCAIHCAAGSTAIPSAAMCNAGLWSVVQCVAN
eukprot:gene10160-1834_t